MFVFSRRKLDFSPLGKNTTTHAESPPTDTPRRARRRLPRLNMLILNTSLAQTTCSTRTTRASRFGTVPRITNTPNPCDTSIHSSVRTTTSFSFGTPRVYRTVANAFRDDTSPSNDSSNAPRSYTSEYSLDGDESYSLFGSPDFGPPENAGNEELPRESSWGSGVETTNNFFPETYPSPTEDLPPRAMDAVTHTSTHPRHPHVVSIKLPRPITDHITFAPRTPPPPSSAVAELADMDADAFTFEPTGAVVTAVKNPQGGLGLAFGVVEPGDILACLVDEWKHPVNFFTTEAPYSQIERAIHEKTTRPVTLRFQRFLDDDESIEPGEFLGAHTSDRASVHNS